MPLINSLSKILCETAGSIRSAVVGPIATKFELYKYRLDACNAQLDWDWRNLPNRIAAVNLLLQGRLQGNYLEIGCDSDTLFNSVPIENKIGVDPERGGNLRLTSDAFFSGNKTKFDVIFIDGLHTYEQVRRDVINSINSLQDGGWVGLHDLLPKNWIEEHVPRIGQGAWTGDVWKVAFELANTPGVEFRILKIDRGVGIFRLRSGNVSLADMRSELELAKFEYLVRNIQRLPICDWQAGVDWVRKSGKHPQ